eukprot:c11445_g1_i1.p1 GENE.c11445_g1_i1~~c11445_g1_i1.p1  ORF type:complete len:575 (-),score=99.94 c11445_g1_i1:228-1952(-)
MATSNKLSNHKAKTPQVAWVDSDTEKNTFSESGVVQIELTSPPLQGKANLQQTSSSLDKRRLSLVSQASNVQSAAMTVARQMTMKNGQYDQKAHFSRLRRFNRWTTRPLYPRKIEYIVVHSTNKSRPEPHVRSPQERFHLALSDPRASLFGSRFTIIMLTLIVISCISFIVETLPEMNEYKTGCEKCKPLTGAVLLDDDAVATRAALYDACTDCVPTPKAVFGVIEKFCIAAFSLEYMGRLLTAYSVRTHIESRNNSSPLFASPFRGVHRTLLFIFNPINIFDLIAILPFYIKLFSPAFNAKLAVFRLFRLFRIFLIPEFGNLSEKLSLFLQMVSNLTVYFLVFMVFSLLSALVFASVVFYIENGTWESATGEYYTQPLYYLDPKIPSLFTSIPTSLWWTIVSITTCGYGEIVPESTAGQAIASVALYSGILLLSLPITVMGISLADFYLAEKGKLAHEKRVMNRTANILHTMMSTHHLPMRRGWNTWIAFVKEQQARESSLQTLVQNQLAPLERKLIELTRRRGKLVNDAVIQSLRFELRDVSEQVLLMWRKQLQELRKDAMVVIEKRNSKVR